ncbi:hypothetical protein [Streptomyces spongiae]|uniref:Uncharacterized protein n=1 Tax=Streptomyces spongiae TaxID=565072 RepID=A0A5N8XQV6_9ACTN|nr:hypothetical protein [Streptomyces spongiae]MPY61802.1 hypothetical protein [Streptomyces spongiae]
MLALQGEEHVNRRSPRARDREGKGLINVTETVKDLAGEPEKSLSRKVAYAVAEFLAPFMPGAGNSVGALPKAASKVGKLLKLLRKLVTKSETKGVKGADANVAAAVTPKGAPPAAASPGGKASGQPSEGLSRRTSNTGAFSTSRCPCRNAWSTRPPSGQASGSTASA